MRGCPVVSEFEQLNSTGRAQVVIYSWTDDPQKIDEACIRGAHGYVSKAANGLRKTGQAVPMASPCNRTRRL